MEVDETQAQASKFSRVANGKNDTSKLGAGGGGGGGVGGVGSSLLGAVAVAEGNRLRGWQHSSRIIRVSRASGGKDRHSKVWTAKGPRDRRVRLSVSTAIQFYDLQDRLGFDQPSKAVEWLIKSARDAIDELPSLEGAFPETPRQQSDEKRPGLSVVPGEHGFDSSAELDLDGDPGFGPTQRQHGSNLSRSSACSSNSENSKGSGGLSLSRNEIRVKARERARERTAKEKTIEMTNPNEASNHQLTQQSSSSFTQLLTAGIGNMGNASGVNSSAMDSYFNATGLMAGSSSSPHQMLHLGNSGLMTVSPYNQNHSQNQSHHHHEFQNLPFVTDHYNLNFLPSSSGALAAGFNINRGTLQSNSSQSLLPHQLQRFSASSQLDGTTMAPFFLGTAVENQHQQDHHGGVSLFPPGLQLYYGDNGGRQSDQKGKGKN